MKILVLGGTGTVGSAVVPALQAKGHAVRVLTRSADKARSAPEGIDVRVGDLADPMGLGAQALEAERAGVALQGVDAAEDFVDALRIEGPSLQGEQVLLRGLEALPGFGEEGASEGSEVDRHGVRES